MMKFMSFRIVWNDKFGTPSDVAKTPTHDEVKGWKVPSPKTNMEAENEGFQKESPFPEVQFQVLC